MKFIDEFDIELVNQALQFETADCRVQGGCDLFTTKAAGSDKKLYKTIDNHLNALLKESAEVSINPPKQNPYYPRSYSSTYYVTAKPYRSSSVSSAYEPATRRKSDSVDPAVVNQNSSISYHSSMSSNSSNQGSAPITIPKRSHKINIDSPNITTSNVEEIENSFTKPNNNDKNESDSNSNGGKDIYDKIDSARTVSTESNSENPSTPNKIYDLVNQSPFGPLNHTNSRRTFAYLIGVLNSTYPDHDFSSLEPTDFTKITSQELIEKFNNTIISLGKLPMEWIWDTLRNHIDLQECDVYFYTPSQSFLEDEPESLWSLMWFIFNKKRKRVAYLYLNAIQRSVPFRNTYYIGSGGKRRKSITIDYEDEDSYDEFDYYDEDYAEEALMSDIDEEESD